MRGAPASASRPAGVQLAEPRRQDLEDRDCHRMSHTGDTFLRVTAHAAISAQGQGRGAARPRRLTKNLAASFGVPVYCFRLPFTMPSRTLLGLTEEQFFLQDDDERRVWLKSSATDGERLCDATSLVIRGEGYANEEEAAREGRAVEGRHLSCLRPRPPRRRLRGPQAVRDPNEGGRGVVLRADGTPSAGRPARCHCLRGSTGPSVCRFERRGV